MEHELQLESRQPPSGMVLQYQQSDLQFADCSSTYALPCICDWNKLKTGGKRAPLLLLFDMVDVAELTRWILSICLLAGALSHTDLLSIIDALLCLLTPWVLIRSSFTRFRFFFVVALIGLITSSLALLIVAALHIFSVTQRGKDLFSEECASNVRILQHLGLNFWMHTTNKLALVLELLANVMIICKERKAIDR